MRGLYLPLVNKTLRTILYPFRSVIPSRFKFPVEGTIRVRLHHSCFYLSGNATSPVLKNIFWEGAEQFEYPSSHVLFKLMKNASVFMDIGANIGFYSLASCALNPSIRVYAFEPLPAAFKFLQKNCRINHFDQIQCHPYALSDKEGKARFHIRINPRFSFLRDHLYGDSSLKDISTQRKEQKVISVECITLDNFSEKFLSGQGPDLIKMDTEGTEDKVLKGGHHTLTKYKPVIMCEIIRGQIEKEMEVLFASMGYGFYEVTPDGGLRKVAALQVGSEIKKDFFMIHPESPLISGSGVSFH